MALISATSLAGISLLLYLFSFILLALLRFATGISIQRIGYFSLKRISITPREGLRIELRTLGLGVHRPTHAQPTWVSLVLKDLKVIIDPAASGKAAPKNHGFLSSRFGHNDQSDNISNQPSHRKSGRSKLWQQLTKAKETLKRIHRQIKWLRNIDISAIGTTLEIVGVGSVHVTSFTMAVHTRRKLLERTRLFRHKKDPHGDQKPAEWIITIRSVLLGVGTREPVEVLDVLGMNVHGLLYKDREGLRDTSIAVKAGRLYVPVDDLLHFSHRSKAMKRQAKDAREADLQSPLSPLSPVHEVSLEDVVSELDTPGGREASIVQTVAESKEFFSSILRGVQEIQVGLSFIRISKELDGLRQANLPLVANIVTHEIGIDLHRLDQSAPAHRMYFSREDVAHQALVAAVSISVSLDEDDTSSNKIIYIPMATTTIRTTLPSKTISLSNGRDVAERNTNILFANLVMTSPSVDLIPQQLIRLLALLPVKSSPPPTRDSAHRLISRLLPKASIKFSVHEPVVRFVLPVADPKHDAPGEYDMIISAISSISLDLESSHSTSGEHLYSLASTFRIVGHHLYYQAASGIKHNLMVTDTLELKANVTASTEVVVIISGNLRTFSILMVREEVSKGIYNIVRHLKRNVEPEKLPATPTLTHTSFLRKLPQWLLEFHFEGSNCSFEMAGIDSNISSQTRGTALELESWTADYRAHRDEATKSPSSKRKTSNSVRQDETFANVHHLSPPKSPSKTQVSDPSDGRRLTLHCRGLEGFIIESLDRWEAQPYLSMPRLEVAFSTSRDLQGPLFHINSAIRAFYLDLSLYRIYSMGVAGSILKDAFIGPVKPGQPVKATAPAVLEAPAPIHGRAPSSGPSELISLDLKASYLRVKATLPADPPVLLQFYDVSAGRHRWSAPFFRCLLARLHVESPHVKRVWVRILVLSHLRVDLRQSRKKTLHGTVEEKSVDVSTELLKIGVPHGVKPYLIFDNIINTVKTITQLKHRFKTRSNEYILKKQPETAKKVPRVSVRTRAFMFELEDDPFEWKLGLIYHTGRGEQKQRLAREEAFDLKKLKIRKAADEKYSRSTSRFRNQSTQPRSASADRRENGRSRSREPHSPGRQRSHSRGRRGRAGNKLRYDREGVCALTCEAKIHEQEAWQKLQEHNARAWKRRIDTMVAFQKNTITTMRKMFSNADEPPPDENEHETVLGVSPRPGIMTLFVQDLHLVLDKPSFHLHDLPKFLHDVGKGMPYSMQYSLLIPLSLSIDMGEARMLLRDYPLNLLHIPALRPGQPPRLPSWSVRTDFVIAEEFRDEESIRHIKVDIVPKGQHAEDGSEIPGFSIDVRRTCSPVKTYAQPVIDINTSLPTTISWGTSYQPVIQDMMQIIETFTKPEIDPSERVGFWDKIRMSFHSRVTVNWKGDGDVQLRLKGSRDPYVVTGYGAGFVMCWRNDVQWLVHSGEDPRKFMTVRSGEYVLAIPDYSHEARSTPEQRSDQEVDASSVTSLNRNAAVFQKVIMKLSGNVQWTAGLVFERDLPNGDRTSDFIPHYDVVLRNPKQMHHLDLSTYDAFRGFRSDHIHLSIAVAAPFDRDWTSGDTKPSDSYNSIHLSPRFFSHFFNWWSLFSGVMSLPVRQGHLWTGPVKKSKKFGRHLATIKYGLLFSPLFIAHVYKHKDAEDYQEDVVSATGLKLKIDSFMLDLHQRREYFDTLSKTKSKQMRTSSMKIYKAEVDFMRADIRAVAASIAGTTAEDLKRANDEILSSYMDTPPQIDMSQFEIPDHDFSWIDMDDFVELDWILPAESNPQTKVLPLAFTPRFTYFRQTEHEDAIQGNETRSSPFGEEDTHFCVMSHHSDPRTVQMSLIENRLIDIEEKMKSHVRLMGEHELRVVREGDHEPTLKEIHDSLEAQKQELESKQRFLEHGLRRLAGHANPGEAGDENSPDGSSSGVRSSTDLPRDHPANHVDMDGLYSASHDEFASDFNNRFIIHNVQLKWNNSLRNIILRYSHQVSQRRGFVYYMSRRAVKFILDIVDEQSKSKRHARQDGNGNVPPTPSVISPMEERDEDTVVQDRIEQLLKDANRFVDADETMPPEMVEGDEPAFGESVAENFTPMNTYHVRLIAPQIQMQSEKNPKACVLVSAKGMQLKIVAIMDKTRMSDDVSGLVQRRFALDMDGAQFFVTNQRRLAKYLHLYSGNRYGSAPGSEWPPWVSLEAMFDFHLDPFGFQRVIQKTSASMRYEKYNPLRLKYNEEVGSQDGEHVKKSYGSESRIDHLWVDFPRIRASCDSAQYYTMYIIVLDLLLYSEPLEKTRSERLEKIMLASDFSDLRGSPEMAERLQERIRQLQELKLHFQINAKYLDKSGWQDRINLEKDLTTCEDELFFIMKAINTSQQRNDDRKGTQTSGFLRWYLSASEIVWHLMRDQSEPLLEFQLGNAAYERVDNSDGSNHNAIEVQRIRGWNLLKTALYPDIIGPFQDPALKGDKLLNHQKMLSVHWYMLEAIAGIPVLEDFQVNMHPLKVQIERDLGKKLFEYIFPGVGSNAFEGGFSPLNINVNDEENEEDEKARLALMGETEMRISSHELRRTSEVGAMGRRLRPTYNLRYDSHRPSIAQSKDKSKGLGISTEHHHRLFKHNNTSETRQSISQPHTPAKKSSSSSLRKREASTTSLTAMNDKEDRRWGLHRSASHDKKSIKSKKSEKPGNDVSQMLARASNYMTLAHVKLNSFVICLSYKGKDSHNIEDLHNFVFRIPTMEYSNKTWSNLDLALRIKKDLIRALISHTGAILGNKFTHHRASKKQQDRFREIANSSTLIPNSDSLLNEVNTSESNSLYSFSQDGDTYDSPRLSFAQSGSATQSPIPGTPNPNGNGNGNGHHHGHHGSLAALAPGSLLRSGSWASSINMASGPTHPGPGPSKGNLAVVVHALHLKQRA